MLTIEKSKNLYLLQGNIIQIKGKTPLKFRIESRAIVMNTNDARYDGKYHFCRASGAHLLIGAFLDFVCTFFYFQLKN